VTGEETAGAKNTISGGTGGQGEAVAGDTVNEISGGIFFSAVIQGRDITVQLPQEVTPALSGLPARSPGFAGRQADLDEMLGVLAPQEANAPEVTDAPVCVVAVAGMPGVGKTELAVQAARAALHNGWFPGGALFTDMLGYGRARGREVAEALDGLLRALGLSGENIPAYEQDRTRLYASVLAKYAEEGRRILVVIDNASSAEQVRALLPTDEATGAIVTSRDDLGMPGTRLVDLGVLTPGESVEVLDRALQAAHPGDTRVTDAAEAADQIADLCGGLPLALQIVAALLAEDPGRSLPMTAADLSAAISLLEEMQIGEREVRAPFDLSYQRLDPQRARLFRLLPVNTGPDILIASTAALAGIDNPATRHDLEALARAHLIDRNAPRGDYRRWRIHDLLRLYARELSDTYAQTDGREQARDRLLSYYLDTARAADAHLGALPGMDLPGVFTGREDALAWLDSERPGLVAAVSVAADTGRDQAVLRLSSALAEYLALRRRFDDWVATTTLSLDAARRLGDRSGEGTALTNLGAALQEVRQFEEAITACQDAAAIYRETGDRNGEASALNNLGQALQRVRRFQEAIDAHQDDLAIRRETGDRNGEARALNNLGSALEEVRRFEEAITACQDAAAIYRETGDRHGEGMALNNLGLALQEVRRFEEAITACQDAAAIYRETGDRYSEGMALTILGAALREVRRFEEAITACQDAAAIYRETGDRYSEGMALNNLGSALQGVRRFEEAITAHHGDLAIRRATGDRHGEGMALNNLGLALQEVRRFDEAVSALRNAAGIFQETGDRHREGTALGNLGIALREMRRFDEAVTVHQDAAAIFRETGDRPREGSALGNLGIALQEMRRFDEAVTVHQDAAAIFRETGDRNGEASALGNLGIALQEVRRFDEAVSALRNAAGIFQETGDRYSEAQALGNLETVKAAQRT
jgi:tetratricopeptide (TPR) repeat protein